MRVRSAAFMASAGFLVAGVWAGAQDPRKPGLWEITTTTTWQQTPFPAGMQMPPQLAAIFGGAPQTAPYCLTQAMADRFGAALPQSRGSCQVSNLQKTADSMSADWICTGAMSGKGTLESHFSGDGTAKGKVHFLGTMQMGHNTTPVEWTAESTSVYKGPDCGNVKPPPMPDQK